MSGRPSSAEHPFAEYVRAVGKGPKMFRDLEEDEAEAAMSMILAEEVEPLQLGAFLMLLRRKGETAAELAGFVRAVKTHCAGIRLSACADLDWPSYADRHRQQPWFILSALLLAANGVKVLMHGTAGEEEGFAPTRGALAALGIRPVSTLGEAAERMSETGFAYLRIEDFCPALERLFRMRRLLGVRTAVNTFSRALNPMAAPAQVVGVFHSAYRNLHRDIALRLGQPRSAAFKGIGGEAQRSPFKECVLSGIEDGRSVEEAWPPMAEPGSPPYRWRDEELDTGLLVGLWRGEHETEMPLKAVIATAAVALKTLGRAASTDEAEALATAMWRDRRTIA